MNNRNPKGALYQALVCYKNENSSEYERQKAVEVILNSKRNMLEHIIYKTYDVYGAKELTCKGYTEQDMLNVAILGALEALSRFDIEDASRKASGNGTGIVKMFTSYCHQYAAAAVKREIGQINGLTEHYEKMFIKSKTAGLDINVDSKELYDVYADYRDPQALIMKLRELVSMANPEPLSSALDLKADFYSKENTIIPQIQKALTKEEYAFLCDYADGETTPYLCEVYHLLGLKDVRRKIDEIRKKLAFLNPDENVCCVSTIDYCDMEEIVLL